MPRGASRLPPSPAWPACSSPGRRCGAEWDEGREAGWRIPADDM
jgi:hypothetical protein